MDFKKASDCAAAAGITLEQIAEASGSELQMIHHARMYPASSGYKPPPQGWEVVLAKLARERATSLEGLASELEKGLNGKDRPGRRDGTAPRVISGGSG